MLKILSGSNWKQFLALSICLFISAPVQADQYYDAGLKSFQSKNFSLAAQYFEQSIKDAPWESNTYYYCALAYHYLGDFKKASAKYAECLERFPGTKACDQSMAALKVIDPGYFKRKAEAVAAAAAANAGKPAASAGAGGASEDKGTVEGEQSRVFFRKNASDMVVDVRVNGRNTRAIFDPNGESTSFSRQQLASLVINPEKGATEMRMEIALGGVTRKNFPVTISDSSAPARIGNSFLDAFNVNVDENAKVIDLKRRSAVSGAAASVSFTREGKDIILVSCEINGRATQMMFDKDADGVTFTHKQAKSAGLKVDDADAGAKPPPGEGPQRGDPNWVPEEDRAAPPKVLSVRMKFGPVERQHVSCQIHEQGNFKYPKFGPDFVTSGGYKYDMDYKSSKIIFTRK